MQLSPISLAITRLGGVRFSPAALFPSGTAGAWYDPSDSTTLFEDTAGTTPSPTPGGGALSVVGLMLDKSQGLVLGSELVTNGDFNGGTTGWTLAGTGAAFTVTAGVATVTTGSTTTSISRNITTVAGATYQFTITRLGGTSSAANTRPRINGVTQSAPLLSNNTTQTMYFFASGTSTSIGVTFSGSVGETTEIDNISVRELPGNHAISYNTTTARPELSARVNLLTYSEEFNNAIWTRSGINTTGTPPWINVEVAPNGTTTADALFDTNVLSGHRVEQTFTATTSITYTASVYVKPNGIDFVQFFFDSTNFGSNAFAGFNLSSGAVGTVGSSATASISNVGNGWYRCVMSAAATASGTSTLFIALSNINPTTRNPSYTGTGTSGIFIWGADLRPANIGSSVPAYQRIADQYTYDSSGFPRYLVFNGTASGMYTPANLNLSATDKATVFAGVRKLSDAATFSVVSELSTNLNTNAGAFALYAPGSSGTYAIGATGATLQSWGLMSTYTAPITNVLSNSLNLSGANRSTQIVPRVNGALVSLTGGLDSANIGGNFGTYPLYIGARNNASLWLNGYLYSLIVVGAASTAAQISSTESWINVKEGGVY